MKMLVIACETLKEELLHIAEKNNIDINFAWVNSGLHEIPENLCNQLQEEINKYDGHYENLLLAYGSCGGGTIGLKTEMSKLIIPAADDCLSLVLGGNCRRNKIAEDDCAFFMTKGWVRCRREMKNTSLQYLREKYGDELAEEIFKDMYVNYRSIDIIDTDAYDLNEIKNEINEFKTIINLSEKVVKGDLSIIVNFLTKVWDKGFIIKSPGDLIKKSDFDNLQNI